MLEQKALHSTLQVKFSMLVYSKLARLGKRREAGKNFVQWKIKRTIIKFALVMITNFTGND